MKKANRPNKTTDIIPAQEFREHLRSAGLSEDACDEAIRTGIILGLFSPVVGDGGVPCYKAGNETAFKLKDVGEFLRSAWGEMA